MVEMIGSQMNEKQDYLCFKFLPCLNVYDVCCGRGTVGAGEEWGKVMITAQIETRRV